MSIKNQKQEKELCSICMKDYYYYSLPWYEIYDYWFEMKYFHCDDCNKFYCEKCTKIEFERKGSEIMHMHNDGTRHLSCIRCCHKEHARIELEYLKKHMYLNEST